MTPSRRRFLTAAGAAATTSLAGCQRLRRSSAGDVDLRVLNYTAEPQPLRLVLLRPAAGEYESALTFETELTVPTAEGDYPAGRTVRRNVADRRAYVVRVLPKYGDGSWLHHHFYPGEPASEPEGATIDGRLHRAESANELDVRFR